MAEIGKEMVASYDVAITGIERTKAQVAKLDQAIHRLRTANYSSSVPSVTVAAQLGSRDILSTKLDDLEGRVQSAVGSSMASGMALGRRLQEEALNDAETPTGRRRYGSGRGGSAGRNDTSAMIHAIKTNVETLKLSNETRVAGWHGWPATDRLRRFAYQEKGTRRGIAPANSLGIAIFTVREYLRRELGKLKR